MSTIEAALKSLVEKTQEGKQAHRSHAFAPMKSIQRKVVHELAEYYGCETQSYDEEPNTNVVATATRWVAVCVHRMARHARTSSFEFCGRLSILNQSSNS